MVIEIIEFCSMRLSSGARGREFESRRSDQHLAQIKTSYARDCARETPAIALQLPCIYEAECLRWNHAGRLRLGTTVASRFSTARLASAWGAKLPCLPAPRPFGIETEMARPNAGFAKFWNGHFHQFQATPIERLHAGSSSAA